VTDSAYLLLAAVVALFFVLAVLGTNPTTRNPHVDARRKWWRK
jgi:hypothetical protein